MSPHQGLDDPEPPHSKILKLSLQNQITAEKVIGFTTHSKIISNEQKKKKEQIFIVVTHYSNMSDLWQ